jgi:hypothetical protein
MEAVREWAAQCRGVDTGLPAQLPHSAKNSQAVLDVGVARIRLLTRTPAAYQSI